MTAHLLVVHHTASPATRELLESVLEGTRAEGIEDVEVDVHPALSATASDVLAADGVLLGTPANIGYMSGAMKHFFDTVYYPVLDAKPALPYGSWVTGTTTSRAPDGRSSRSRAPSGGSSRLRRCSSSVRWAGTSGGAFELGGTLAATLMG